MIQTLLIVGGDKLGGQAASFSTGRTDMAVRYDRSSNAARVWQLMRRGVLPPTSIARMAICEFRRPAPPTFAAPEIRTNGQMIQAVTSLRPRRIVLFRAGLIVRREVINLGVPILNVHCARLPEFGGLNSIARALAAQEYRQEATVHRVTEQIDRGEVLMTKPYTLDPDGSYCSNEASAYGAGLDLLERLLDSPGIL